jgi:hypothetical protein
MNGADDIRPLANRAVRMALGLGVIGAVLAIILGFLSPAQFFRSYLVAFAFWVSVPVGCEAILMMHHLTGGWWGLPIRRLLEAGTRTMWVMAVLFIPVLLGMSRLYDWAQPDKVKADPILIYKSPYMNQPFFTVRSIIYFVIWIALAWVLNKWSADQDRTADPGIEGRFITLSAPGLILWGIAVTYSSVDWFMSLEPHWFSTIYGMLWMMVASLLAMSLIVFVLQRISGFEPVKSVILPSRLIDLGNLMLAFLMLWAYLSFSQFLITWQGNVSDEITWYQTRMFHGWRPVAILLIIAHFAVPFLLLLQRPIKRRIARLSLVSAILIVLTLCDVYWLILPAWYPGGPDLHLVDLFLVVGIGGIWVAAFFWQLMRWPLLPLHDPRFEGALQHEHGD